MLKAMGHASKCISTLASILGLGLVAQMLIISASFFFPGIFLHASKSVRYSDVDPDDCRFVIFTEFRHGSCIDIFSRNTGMAEVLSIKNSVTCISRLDSKSVGVLAGFPLRCTVFYTCDPTDSWYLAICKLMAGRPCSLPLLGGVKFSVIYTSFAIDLLAIGVSIWMLIKATSLCKHYFGGFMRCSSCGYDLTGCVSASCPECGTVFSRQSKLVSLHTNS